MKKTYVLAGASGRALYMFAQPIVKDFSDCAEIVGVFDPNPLRIEALKKEAGLTCPSYTDFDKMISELKPDRCIVACIDKAHHEFTIKSLEAGIDVITEKPMTIDAEKCNAVLEAEKRTGRKVIVTFNYRFTPYVTAVKQAIRDGVIGDVLNVDFEYLLNTTHGADYFRRWHSQKKNSGGLLVHKSTHHFDLINWWIEEEPVNVMAFGTRRFYGPTREERGERCSNCPYAKSCEFYFDLSADDFNRKMYKECESADGYYRDRCLFSDVIDIEDTMSVNVQYSKGAALSYSLIAHCPYEGYKASINGTKGRIEAAEYHTGLNHDDPCFYFDVYDRNGRKVNYAIPKSTGGHGGGDAKLLEMIIRGGIPDPLGHCAGSYAGAISILIGIASNKSMAEGKNIRIKDLVPLDEYKK